MLALLASAAAHHRMPRSSAPLTDALHRMAEKRPFKVQPAWFASEHKRFGASRLVSRLASSSGAVGLKLSLGGILDHVAPCPDSASRRAPSPRLHAPSLNLPFPTHGRSFTTKAQLLHPDSPSSPCCRCGSYFIPFLCRLLRSAATPFGLCPRSFLNHPPLGFARPLFRKSSPFSLCRLRIAFGRLSPSAPWLAASFTYTHPPGRCLESQPHTAVLSLPVPLNSLSSPSTIAWTITSSRHFTILDRQRC